jgi:hypothetical protein
VASEPATSVLCRKLHQMHHRLYDRVKHSTRTELNHEAGQMRFFLRYRHYLLKPSKIFRETADRQPGRWTRCNLPLRNQYWSATRSPSL